MPYHFLISSFHELSVNLPSFCCVQTGQDESHSDRELDGAEPNDASVKCILEETGDYKSGKSQPASKNATRASSLEDKTSAR